MLGYLQRAQPYILLPQKIFPLLFILEHQDIFLKS